MSLMISSDRTPRSQYVCNLVPIQPIIRQAPAAQPLQDTNWADKTMQRLSNTGGYLKEMGFGFQPDQTSMTGKVLKDGDTFLGGLSKGVESFIGKGNHSMIGKIGHVGAKVLGTATSVSNVLVSMHNDKLNGVQASSRTLAEIAMSTGQIAAMALIGAGLAATSGPIVVGSGVLITGYAMGKGLDLIRERIHNEPSEKAATHMIVCTRLEKSSLPDKAVN